MPSDIEDSVLDWVLMPAGVYYVGDPCYAFEAHEDWMNWLEAAKYEEDGLRFLVADVRGKKVVGVKTFEGDGCFRGNDGHEYGVDAGLLGAVPVEVATDNALYAMQKVVFPEDFIVGYHDGVISIGRITIDTDPGEFEWPDYGW